MNESEARKVLDEVRLLWINPSARPIELSGIWVKMHALAEAKYPLAKELFISGLDDASWDWREYCLSCLGYHYDLHLESDVLDKIRRLLLTDPEGQVRLSAAGVLGVQSTWPDGALINALRFDEDKFVRRSAFDSILKLASAPNNRIRKLNQRIESGDIQPTWNEAKQILEELGAEVPSL